MEVIHQRHGDIIFFDWADSNDGQADHTGIVEKVENNKVDLKIYQWKEQSASAFFVPSNLSFEPKGEKS